MKMYKGFEITPVYGLHAEDYFWCGPDFDGGDIDFETPTQDPHGSGSLQQCREAIDELLAEWAMDICVEACGIGCPEYMQFNSIGEQ